MSQAPASGMVSCPHCGSGNPAGTSFCESCGKALPTPVGGPRVVEGADLASSSGGRRLQSAELAKKAKAAAGALLAVAILQTIFGVIIYFMAKNEVERDPTLELEASAFVFLGVIAAGYYGLWLWARSNPLPPAIIGLVVYITLWLMDVIADPTMIYKGILIKVIIVAVLVKAIQAGMQHRELLRQGDAA